MTEEKWKHVMMVVCLVCLSNRTHIIGVHVYTAKKGGNDKVHLLLIYVCFAWKVVFFSAFSQVSEIVLLISGLLKKCNSCLRGIPQKHLQKKKSYMV